MSIMFHIFIYTQTQSQSLFFSKMDKYEQDE